MHADPGANALSESLSEHHFANSSLHMSAVAAGKTDLGSAVSCAPGYSGSLLAMDFCGVWAACEETKL
ncbi:MAG: hypothetical protein EBU27_01420 [Opitutae bacterium]|nr:hypothetical protein [Opitutae bacterium]